MADHHGDNPITVPDSDDDVEKSVNLEDASEAVATMETEKNEIRLRCTKMVGSGSCKNLASKGDVFCLKHLSNFSKKKTAEKRKAGDVSSDGVREATRIRAQNDDAYCVDECISGRASVRRGKHPNVKIEKYLEEISENCHQCQRNDKGGVIRCKNCKRKRYCYPCASRWYELSFDDIAVKCPFCREMCNCKACLRDDKIDQSLRTPRVYSNEEKHQLSKYLILSLLPHLREMYNEQQTEKDLEAEIRGIPPYQMHVPRAHCWEDAQAYCDYCRTSIVDYHRSCSKCSFDLCLACCSEVRNGSIKKIDKEVNFQYVDEGKEYIHGEVTKSKTFGKFEPIPVSPKDKNVASSSWVAAENGSIPCPSASRGGCGSGFLDLYCILPDDTVADLVNDAEMALFIHGIKDETQRSSKYCSCFDEKGCTVTNNENLCSAACRDASFDNNLYCPTLEQIQGEALDHVQSHWFKGHPMIVRQALESSTGLSWEPKVMWRALRQMSNMHKDRLLDVTVLDCLEWKEVKINIHRFFDGYLRTQLDDYKCPQMLKLDDWPSSNRFEEMLPRHCAEFLRCLPLKDYTHPLNGYWNLATKLPHGCLKPDVGPKMYIAYGVTQELERGDSVTKLHSDMTDAVYLLTHAVNLSLHSCNMHFLKERHRAQDIMELHGGMEDLANSQPRSQNGTVDEESVKETEGAAIWDVFRRQDVPKLQEYLRKHHSEFRHSYCKPVYKIYHPIHDQRLYLSSKHKQKLKEEYGIEPWTFSQKLGDAVFIPAGCPNQVRNVKSCIKVAVNFLSPESIGESLRLVEEFRQLPNNHEAKENKLEVKKMLIHAMSEAISDLTGTNKSLDQGLGEKENGQKKKRALRKRRR